MNHANLNIIHLTEINFYSRIYCKNNIFLKPFGFWKNVPLGVGAPIRWKLGIFAYRLIEVMSTFVK